MRTDTARLYAAFEKIEEQEDGTLKVYGIASSETVDSDGETIRASAVKAALPDYLQFGAIREMHQPIAAGTAIEASVDAAGVTHLAAHIVDASSVLKVKTSVLKGFSIGGKVTKRDPMNKRIITGLKLSEISLVDRPANPDAMITLVKFDGRGRPLIVKTDSDASVVDAPSVRLGAMKKGMYDVGILAELISRLDSLRMWSLDEANWEGDTSEVPGQLAAAVVNLCEILRVMVDEETAELLGIAGDATVDVAAAAKACAPLMLELAKKGAKFSKDTVETLGAVHKMLDDGCSMMHKLGYTKADNQQGDDDMTDAEKAAAADDLAKATGRVTTLETEQSAMKVRLDALEKRNGELETEVATERKTAKELAELVEKSGILTLKAPALRASVHAVKKSEDVAAGGKDDEIDKSKKPTDFDAEFRSTFRRPLSPMGLTPLTR